MSSKLHLAISAALQAVLFAGTFYSLEQPVRVARQTDQNEAFAAGVFPGSRPPVFDARAGQGSYGFQQWNAALAQNGSSAQTEAIK